MPDKFYEDILVYGYYSVINKPITYAHSVTVALVQFSGIRLV